MLYISHVGILGGAERSLVDLISAVDQSRFDIRVVLPAAGEFSDRLARMQIPFAFCPHLSRLRQSAALPEKLAQALRLAAGAANLRILMHRLCPDIVHANSTTAALYTLCLPGVPAMTIWHLRDLVLPSRIGRLLGRKATRIVVPSKSCHEVAAASGAPHKVALVPNGINLQDWHHRARAGAERPLTITMVGQLAAWKGHLLAIETAALVISQCPNVRFRIVADDRLSPLPLTRDELRRAIASLGLAEYVAVDGYRDDIVHLFSQSDIVLHPAFPEPAGRIVMEAMASGCAVVACDGPHGPAEIIENGVDGLLVGPRTASTLARAVIGLVADPLSRARLGDAARAKAITQFDRKLSAQRIEALYASLLQASGAETA